MRPKFPGEQSAMSVVLVTRQEHALYRKAVFARAVQAWARPAFRCPQSNGRSLINEELRNFRFPSNLSKNLTFSYNY